MRSLGRQLRQLIDQAGDPALGLLCGTHLAAGAAMLVLLRSRGALHSPNLWLYVLLGLAIAWLVGVAGTDSLRRAASALAAGGSRHQEIQERWLRERGEAAARAERDRFARDLHDAVKQQLFGIHLGLATIEQRWGADPQGALGALADVRRALCEVQVEMRGLLHQLEPAALAELGLVAALREQCAALAARTGAQVDFRAEGTLEEDLADGRIPFSLQEQLFRSAQEALSNVARHARARRVVVCLEAQGAVVRLRVADDGQGLAPGAEGRGLGLYNLRERARSSAGELTLDSAPGRGTTLTLAFPLPAAAGEVAP